MSPAPKGQKAPKRRTARADLKRKAIARERADAVMSTAVVVVPPATAGALLVARDWRGLIGAEADVKCEWLVALVMADTSEADAVGWSDVLAMAGIPWLAWTIMRKDVTWAQEVFEAWRIRKASWLASSVVRQADSGEQVLKSDVEGKPDLVLPPTKEAISFARNKMAARLWLAERFDPAVFAKKTHVHSTVEETRVVRIEIVDEGPQTRRE